MAHHKKYVKRQRQEEYNKKSTFVSKKVISNEINNQLCVKNYKMMYIK